MNHVRRHVWGVLIAALMCGAALSGTGASAPHQDFKLTGQQGTYSLEARDANLYEILDAVQKQSGLAFVIDPLLREERVTTELFDVGLDTLLRSLVSSHALVYEREDDTIRLAGGSLTSQQEALPFVKEEEPPVREAAAPRPRPTALGMLTNSDRSLDQLTRRDGVPSLVFQNAILDTQALLEEGRSLPIPPAFQAAPDTEVHVVQFDRPVSDQDRSALAGAGAEVAHYVPRYAFAVRADAEALAQVRQIPDVIHVEPYHPWFKLSDELTAHLGRGEPVRSGSPIEDGLFNLLAFPNADAAQVLASHGIEVVETSRIEGQEVFTVRGSLASLEGLVKEDAVQWAEVKHPMRALNDLAADTIRATEFKRLHPTLDGGGVIVAVVDSGVDDRHRGFAINPALPTALGMNTRVVFYEARPGGPTSDGVIGDTDGHGTHVAGTVLGNGALSETANAVPGSGPAPYESGRFKGLAPGAQLVMLEDFNSIPYAEQTAIAYNQGARISNNSWGNTTFSYGLASMAFDALVRDAAPNTPGQQPLTLFFAAGNSGGGDRNGLGGTATTIGEPANAKNVITVGAIEQIRNANNLIASGSLEETDSDWQVASFSSRGPVTPTDPRIKPEIVAPGVYTISTQSRDRDYDNFSDPNDFEFDLRNGNVDTGTNYAFLSGTSMASPTAAGAAALIYQKLTQEMGRNPSPALMKALMVNGAQRLDTFTYRFPSFRVSPTIVYEGFGRIDVPRSIDGPMTQPSDELILLDQDQVTPVGTGETWTFPITIGPQDGGLKVTLVWTDPPGSPGTGVQLINDIDLLVRRPDGTTGYGGNRWGADGVHSEFLDPLELLLLDEHNNVELVSIPDPVPGTYTIEVYGWNVPQGPQDFAVVIARGEGVQGRVEGERPHMVLDDEERPVVAFSAFDAGGNRQIFLKRWHGNLTGDVSPTNRWKEMQGQWHGIADSLSRTGVSQTPDPSHLPVVAVHGSNIWVAWQQFTGDPEEPSHIYARRFNGMEWVEVDNSARLTGVSKNPTFDAVNPAIAIGPDGLPVIAWEQRLSAAITDPPRRIFLARFNGTQWVGLGGSATTGIPGSIESLEPKVAIDSVGRIVVAWQELDTDKIRVRRWTGTTGESLVDAGYAGSGGLAYARRVDLAIGPGNVPFLAWQQVQDPRPGGGQWTQVYVARWSGSAWVGFGGSTTYPGITGSASLTMTPIRPTLDVRSNTDVVVAWQRTTADDNAILLKRWNGTSWVGVDGSQLLTGIESRGGLSQAPIVAIDSIGVPFVTYYNNADGLQEVLSFSQVLDRDPPIFDGLANAVGVSANSVQLSWQPAIDISEPITYLIYRSPISFGCGQTPNCTVAQTFGNQIATTTSTTFTVSGLTGGQAYCFAVRARDATGLVDDNTVIRTASPITGAGDLDGDCLDNLIEIEIGTDICLRDTDEDGMWDGWEYTYSTNNPAHTNLLAMDPLDNGINNLRTLIANDGDPMQHPDADLDGDGATNFEEFMWWLTNVHAVVGCEADPSFRLGPDPTNPDTDGDGIPDGWEMFFGLDPTDPSDADEDPDNDGLTNLEEYLNGGDPFNPDTDGDGVLDGDEVDQGTRVDAADSDGDGLDDGDDPNPTNWDASGNLLSDGDMVQLGHDPADMSVVAYNILLHETFETNSLTVGDWTSSSANPATPTNLWHLSTADPVPNTTGIAFPYERTTDRAYRLANDPTASDPEATYDVGNQGINAQLISPVIDASGATNLWLRWNEFYDTQPTFDQVRVFARRVGDIGWTPVNTARSGNSGGWTNRVVDLFQFAGEPEIQVRFLFSANPVLNRFKGWYVDDVVVYEAASIEGWVRDENGRPVVGAEVRALGQGGITNRIDNHALVRPGKIFGAAFTASNGMFRISNLPVGDYVVKANDGSLRAEFWNGPLTTGTYGFGNHLNRGVYRRQDVTTLMELTSAGQVSVAEFELGRGAGRASLGVASDGGAAVDLNFVPAMVWNGSTNAAVMVPYTSDRPLVNNEPDWLTNAVAPNLLQDLAPGIYVPSLEGASWTSPLPQVEVREGETTLITISTNQPSGRLTVRAADGGSYPIWVNNQDTGVMTPANLPIRAGRHLVTLRPPAGAKWPPQKVVDVPVAGRGTVIFSVNDLSGPTGDLLVQTTDFFGAAVTGAQIFVNGMLITSNEVAAGASFETPATVLGLQPGLHNVVVRKEGYREVPLRALQLAAGATVPVSFQLLEADRDYDLVGDATEIAGYTNIFLFHRDDDPDEDGLTNFQEFEIFREFGVRLNVFDADSDGDGLSDGEELAIDGEPRYFALSTMESTSAEGGSTVRSFFAGKFLDGINYFQNTGLTASIEGDLFQASTITFDVPTPPAVQSVVTVHGGIPTVSDSRRRLNASHPVGVAIYADTRPDIVDTDGDGMWDGWEQQFSVPNAISPLVDPTNAVPIQTFLDPLEAMRANEDPDGDGLTNLKEFLGRDGIANTNDWLNPAYADTDGDNMDDGWEILFGLDPRDPADALIDIDGDGLSNLEEFFFGSNPLLLDTDGDFLPDGAEMLFESDPNNIDTDGDGLLDGREVWDRDMDGVFDGGFFNNDESNWVLFDYDGDGLLNGPADWDSDGDGMPDGFEVLDMFGNPRVFLDPNCRLDPLNHLDADLDCDGDGLTNLEEYLVMDALIGNHPSLYSPDFAEIVWDRPTDPFNPDTDGDGMPDGWEVLHGLHPTDPVTTQDGTTTLRYARLSVTGDLDGDGLWNLREFNVRFSIDSDADPYDPFGLSTDPWNPDTDEDGLGDGEEDRIFRSNPLLQDTDGDGLMDGTGVDGFFGEVEAEIRADPEVPDLFNHFDQATNDIWILRWAGRPQEALPFWERVEVDPVSPVPSPRWGTAATYIPVFETKNPRDNIPLLSDEDNPAILLDNRQMVIMGGRDGVTRHRDVWEYRVRDNMWTQSVLRLEDPFDLETSEFGPGLTNGLSEHAAVAFFGYRQTRNSTCPCEEVPWNCDGTEFLEPKNRPYVDSRSYDWTYFYGGWDDDHLYKTFTPADPVKFYKSSDDDSSVIEFLANEKEVFETTALELFAVIVTNGNPRLPLGLLSGDHAVRETLDGETQPANFTWAAAGIRFDGAAIFPQCEEVLAAQLVFNVASASGDVDILVYGELSEQSDDDEGSQPDYNVEEGTHPTARLGPGFYNTPPLAITIPAGTDGELTNDITSLLLDLVVTSGVWRANSFGLVITSSDPDVALIRPGTTKLVVEVRPGFKKPPQWAFGAGTYTYVDIPDEALGLRRKSHGMVLDYKRNREGFRGGTMVVFGGMDGNVISDETFEGEFQFNDLDAELFLGFQPENPTWRRILPETRPSARYAHSMVFDSANDRVVMFGGFDENHKPLNDLWAYKDGEWEEILDFVDTSRPPPRGGAMMAFYGGFDYNRNIGEYCVRGNRQRIVLFGGTDGDVYMNDLWIFDHDHTPNDSIIETGPRWILVNPHGQMSQGPSPRAFASMVYAQNVSFPPDPLGLGEYRVSIDDDEEKCARPGLILFGGRTGTLPTGRDTDDDKVDDGVEFAIGRDPRVNALFQESSGLPFTEEIPFAYKPIGTPYFTNVSAIAGMETLSWVDRNGAAPLGLAWQSYPLEITVGTIDGLPLFFSGVDAWLPQMQQQWWHRHGGENAEDPRDEWELGTPSQASLGEQGAPPYAYRGRWVFGTDLDNTYPNNANMQLFSPLFDLILPCDDCTAVGLETSYFLEFYEWLDLADANDAVRIELIRPTSPADVQNRRAGVDKPPIPVLANRNNQHNTDGQWRRVRVPLDIVGAEPQAFLRFSLTSDASGVAGGWYIDDVSIFQGGRISGVVTDSGGMPVAGVPVDLLGSNPNQTVLESTVSDANGLYQFGPLPFGDYQIDLGSVGSGVPVTLSPTAGDESADLSGPPTVLLVGVGPGQVSWAAVPGFSYMVEYAETTLPFNWISLGTVVATTPIQTFVDPAPTPTRVYRVQLVP